MRKSLHNAYRKARGFAGRTKRSLAGYPPRHLYPWYDSLWLSSYVETKAYLARKHPEKLAEFENAVSVLRTDPGFRAVKIDQFFDAAIIDSIRQEVAALPTGGLESHELVPFGRHVVHDNPLFTELQEGVVDRVSEIVGERVEASYNFLSLYRGIGVCDVHLDDPSAKWTLDICIDQSREWPIHVSEVVDWPEYTDLRTRPDWSDAIKASNRFTALTMTPGQAIVFGGSSQWHYRDRMPNATADDYCTLLFFHFAPAGSSDLVYASKWANLLNVPKLKGITG